MTNKKVIVMLIVTIMVSAVFAGCLGGGGGGGDKGGSDGKKEGIKKTGKTNFNGWQDSSDNGYEREAKLTTSLKINDSNLVKITFNIKIDDDDEKHSDENTDADTVEKGEIKSGNFSGKLQKGDTPYTATISFPSSNQTLKDGEFLPQEWNFTVDVTCRGEKTYDFIFLYVVDEDEGFAWNVEVQYEYIDFNATAS